MKRIGGGNDLSERGEFDRQEGKEQGPNEIEDLIDTCSREVARCHSMDL